MEIYLQPTFRLEITKMMVVPHIMGQIHERYCVHLFLITLKTKFYLFFSLVLIAEIGTAAKKKSDLIQETEYCISYFS